MHFHKRDREAFVEYLAARFPKTFFVDASLRRPLKKDILDDLIKQKVLK
jgi:sRNA-binding protein